MMILPPRFWSKVKTSDTHFYNGTPCLEWTACTDYNGYGKFKLNGKTKLAHRLSYEEKYGIIPKGLVINHMCRNRCCINREEHLEIVTQKVNLKKGEHNNQNKEKLRCKQGHEFNEKNTYIYPNGERGCRTCNRINQHPYNQRKKLERITCPMKN